MSRPTTVAAERTPAVVTTSHEGRGWLIGLGMAAFCVPVALWINWRAFMRRAVPSPLEDVRS